MKQYYCSDLKIILLVCRDISFLYDATSPERADSSGKPVIKTGSEKSKTLTGSKQLELLTKSKDENDQDAVVNLVIINSF